MTQRSVRAHSMEIDPAHGQSWGVADNKRVWKKEPSGTEYVYFYGVGGQKLLTYQVASPTFALNQVSVNVYFGGKLIRADGVAVASDRLGSVMGRSTAADSSSVTSHDYFPYGAEIGTATAGNRDKFGTYHRDQSTGLDYADQRYYASTNGRFLTADPYEASGGTGEPGSWNRYPYVMGDPANKLDPRGLVAQDPLFACVNQEWFFGPERCLPEGGGGGGGFDGWGGDAGDHGDGGGWGSGEIDFLQSYGSLTKLGIDDIEKDKDLTQFVDEVVKKLKDDPACRRLLGGGRDFTSANMAINNLGNRFLLATMSPVISGSANIPLPGGSGLGMYAVINRKGAFYRSDINQPFTEFIGASRRGRAYAILHEAGHLLARGLFDHGGVNVFGQPDGPRNQKVSDMIQKECAKTLASFSATI